MRSELPKASLAHFVRNYIASGKSHVKPMADEKKRMCFLKPTDGIVSMMAEIIGKVRGFQLVAIDINEKVKLELESHDSPFKKVLLRFAEDVVTKTTQRLDILYNLWHCIKFNNDLLLQLQYKHQAQEILEHISDMKFAPPRILSISKLCNITSKEKNTANHELINIAKFVCTCDVMLIDSEILLSDTIPDAIPVVKLMYAVAMDPSLEEHRHVKSLLSLIAHAYIVKK